MRVSKVTTRDAQQPPSECPNKPIAWGQSLAFGAQSTTGDTNFSHSALMSAFCSRRTAGWLGPSCLMNIHYPIQDGLADDMVHYLLRAVKTIADNECMAVARQVGGETDCWNRDVCIFSTTAKFSFPVMVLALWPYYRLTDACPRESRYDVRTSAVEAEIGG